MMMCIALRFIPTLIEETDKIINAQKARGADFETGNLLQRAKALVPILVPLFISSFRRADELAVAMECRCYHGGEGRTRLKELHYRPGRRGCAGRRPGIYGGHYRPGRVRTVMPQWGPGRRNTRVYRQLHAPLRAEEGPPCEISPCF